MSEWTGLSFCFHARTARVLLCVGPLVLDDMSIGLFKQMFGVEAVRGLLHERVTA